MFLEEPIAKTNTGHVDHENERRIALRWFDYCGFKYENHPFGKSGGFYWVDNRRKRKKVYICCTRDLGKKNLGKFWFGFPSSHVRGNADMGVIFILVWEDGSREYIVFNNKEMLLWRNLWYLKCDYHSIDIDVVGGKYLMRGKESYKRDVRDTLNNILMLFE